MNRINRINDNAAIRRWARNLVVAAACRAQRPNVAAWGNDDEGESNVPVSLTDPGEYQSLALKSDGTGDGTSPEPAVNTALSNAELRRSGFLMPSDLAG